MWAVVAAAGVVLAATWVARLDWVGSLVSMATGRSLESVISAVSLASVISAGSPASAISAVSLASVTSVGSRASIAGSAAGLPTWVVSAAGIWALVLVATWAVLAAALPAGAWRRLMAACLLAGAGQWAASIGMTAFSSVAASIAASIAASSIRMTAFSSLAASIAASSITASSSRAF